MFDVSKTKRTITIDNCDKDGTMVAKRIASIEGLVAPTRRAKIKVNRQTDYTYAKDMGDKLASLYLKQKKVNRKILILSSVHRYALYLAETLNAVVLPLQIISFAKSWQQAGTTPTTSICGKDYDLDYIWQWNKFTSPEHFPAKYISLMKNADEVIIVRSTDPDDNPDDCEVIGRHNNLYITNTFEKISENERFIKLMSPYMDYDRQNFEHIGQWEWSLPDSCITAAKKIWKSLGKKPGNFYIVQDSTINLYKRIIPLWEEFLSINNIPVRGFSFNPYFTCHPYYEKAAGLLPFNYYKFGMVMGEAAKYVKKYVKNIEASNETVPVFADETEDTDDFEDLQKFLKRFGLDEDAWFSNGLDCPDTSAEDIFGSPIPAPHKKVLEWIEDAPYYGKKFIPLGVRDALRIK